MPKVLIADDDADVRKVLSLMLKHAGGYSVIMAGNGQEAYDLARGEHPDLILMDLNMPVLDGWSATAQIKADAELAMTPVIAVTAHGFGTEYDRALQAGCDTVLTKPVDMTLLLQTVQEYLSRATS